MKILRNITVFSLGFLLVFTACTPNEPSITEQDQNPINQPEIKHDSLILHSQSITDGEEVDATSTTKLELAFNTTISLRPSAKVMCNDEKISPSIQFNRAVIPLKLEKGMSYTILIDPGTFYSREDTLALSPTFILHFTTKAKQSNDHLISELCNPDATPEAKRVYAYLLDIYGESILSSTIANVNWNFSEAELVHKATGKYPAIATMDYIHMLTLTSHSPFNGWTVPYDNTQAVENWWANNGLIAAGWHWNMPANQAAISNPDGYTCTPGMGTINPTKTVVTPSMVMNPKSWAYTIAKEDLDKMVELLGLLQTKGIPVIWRPLHEASGNTYSDYNLVNGKPKGNAAWFWWGVEGAEKYKELWRYMFNYFKNAGVNNLIWVWTSQNNGDIDWYPGDEYVDIIGQDIYNKGVSSNTADYIRLQATYPNKIVTLSECGNVGKISEQWAAGARWSYFMPWYQYNATTLDGHEHANTQWWQDAMNCPYVLTREDMPSFK